MLVQDITNFKFTYPLFIKAVVLNEKNILQEVYVYLENMCKHITLKSCKEVYIKENFLPKKYIIDKVFWNNIFRLTNIEYNTMLVNFEGSVFTYPLTQKLDTIISNKDKTICCFIPLQNFDFQIDFPDNNYCFIL